MIEKEVFERLNDLELIHERNIKIARTAIDLYDKNNSKKK